MTMVQTRDTVTDTSSEFTQDDGGAAEGLTETHGDAHANGSTAHTGTNGTAKRARKSAVEKSDLEDGETAFARAKKAAQADLFNFQGKVDRLRDLLGLPKVEWPEQQRTGSDSNSPRPSRAPSFTTNVVVSKPSAKAPKVGKGGPKGPRSESRAAQIFTFLKDHPGSTAAEIAKAIGAETIQVSAAINSLKGAGKVTGTGNKRNMVWSAV